MHVSSILLSSEKQETICILSLSTMHIHIHVLEKIDSAVAAALKIYINFGDSPQLLTSKQSRLGQFLVIFRGRTLGTFHTFAAITE